MKIQKINEIVNGKLNIDYDFEVQNIKTDSKEIEEGDLFIAIHNGHNYISDAIQKGAVAILAEKEIEYVIPTIQVESSIQALGKIASYIRSQYSIPLIAITGSTGKTTTKELVSYFLSIRYHVLKSIKNHNNHIGLPLTLLNLNDSYDVIVTELGMNHFHEISYLSKICKPNYAVITNIGTAHIGNLGSKKNILKAKLEILDGMKKGVLIVNQNDKYLNKIKYSPMIKVSPKTLKVKHIHYYQDRTEFDIKKVHFVFYIPGKHILNDVLLAIQIGLLFDISLEQMASSILNYQNIEGRLQITKEEYMIIDDSYNSSYESLIGSLQLLKKEKNKKIIILGDMLELGKYSNRYHKKINKYLKKIKNKTVLLIGEYTKVIQGLHFTNIEQINKYLKKNIEPNCIIYIKGSRAMHLDKIKTRFDYEVVNKK